MLKNALGHQGKVLKLILVQAKTNEQTNKGSSEKWEVII